MRELSKPTGFSALSASEKESHRAKIGVRASAILSQFWQDSDTPEAVQTLEIEGWQDVLENCSHSEIRAAWANYQKTGPRTQSGKLYKPDAGALYQLILKSRPRPKIIHDAPNVEPVKRVTAEQAASILQEVGFNPRRFK